MQAATAAEFMSAAGLWGPEDTVLFRSTLTSGSYDLSVPPPLQRSLSRVVTEPQDSGGDAAF